MSKRMLKRPAAPCVRRVTVLTIKKERKEEKEKPTIEQNKATFRNVVREGVVMLLLTQLSYPNTSNIP